MGRWRPCRGSRSRGRWRSESGGLFSPWMWIGVLFCSSSTRLLSPFLLLRRFLPRRTSKILTTAVACSRSYEVLIAYFGSTVPLFIFPVWKYCSIGPWRIPKITLRVGRYNNDMFFFWVCRRRRNDDLKSQNCWWRYDFINYYDMIFDY